MDVILIAVEGAQQLVLLATSSGWIPAKGWNDESNTFFLLVCSINMRYGWHGSTSGLALAQVPR